MNSLLAEIERKRKMNDSLRSKLGGDNQVGTSKFLRYGDRKRMEEEELEEKQKALDEERSKRMKLEEKPASIEISNISNNETSKGEMTSHYTTLTVQEIKNRLREIKQPITLFGETSHERLNRLIEYMMGGGNNDNFEDIKVTGGDASEDEEAELEAADQADDKYQQSKQLNQQNTEDIDSDDDNIQNNTTSSSTNMKNGIIWDPTFLFSKIPDITEEKLVYKFFRTLIKQWEMDLNQRDEYEKRSAKGRLETKTQKQCKDYIRPLFRMCKRKEVPYDIIDKLALMVRNCEEGNFLAANDQYIR